MRDMKVLPLFILVFVALLISSSHISSASDVEPDAASLQGLSEIFVVVEDLPTQVAKSGVSEDQLKAVVEEKLRGAGIKALSMAEYLRTPNLPYFSVYISAFGGKSGLINTTFIVELNQGLYLERNPKMHLVLSTWSTGFVGSGGSVRREDVFVIIEDLVDKFVGAYLLANNIERYENRKSPRSGFSL